MTMTFYYQILMHKNVYYFKLWTLNFYYTVDSNITYSPSLKKIVAPVDGLMGENNSQIIKNARRLLIMIIGEQWGIIDA